MKRPTLAGSTTHPWAKAGLGPTPQRSPAPTGGFAALLDLATHEELVATYCFDPAVERTGASVVVRFLGSRKGAGAKTRPGDQFTRDERIDGVSPKSGLVAVTTRVRGINPGEWIVSARILPADGSQREPRGRSGRALPAQLYPATWSWLRWSLQQSDSRPLKTRLAPFARVPGQIPGVYFVMVVLAVLAALAAQQNVLARVGVPATNALTVSLIAIALGLVGAKARFMADHWRERRIEGWSIQGFLPAAALAGAITLAFTQIPIGAFLDASAPGIFLGMAVGRIGCFFAGCCAGRPTSAWWGVWSSDQRVGMRRIPTQLFESGLGLVIAVLALVVVLGLGARGGSILVAGLSLYTLGRQGILRLRVERPRSLRGNAFTAVAGAVVLVLSVGYGMLAR